MTENDYVSAGLLGLIAEHKITTLAAEAFLLPVMRILLAAYLVRILHLLSQGK
jgi:hypothetical protein